jgi:hypothetical protein
MVAIGVYVPEGAGGVGADLGPESLNVTAAVWVLGWAADGDLKVSDHGAALQCGWAAGSSIVAALLAARTALGANLLL